MGNIFSGSTDFEHACCIIIPKDDDTQVRPTDDMTQKYVEKWADVTMNLEQHATYRSLALELVRGFDYDSLDGFDPELGFRDPKKKKERVVGKYTQLGNLIANKKIIFVCYLHKKNAKDTQRKELRNMVRRNSQNELGGKLTRPASDPSVSKVPKKKKHNTSQSTATHT